PKFLRPLIETLEATPGANAKAKHKRGRTPVIDWNMVDDEVSRLMNYHGAFDLADPKWNCQARLEKEIRKFISNTFGPEKVPVPSTIRKHVSAALAKWREERAKAGN